MVHLGFNLRLRRQLSTKINMPKSSPTTQKCGQGNLTQKILNYLASTPGHLGSTLWIYVNGSRMVHLGFNIWLRRQLSTKINMPKSSLTTQKCGQGNLTQKILNSLTSTWDTLGAHYAYM